jgi:uncharacterized membrane protein
MTEQVYGFLRQIGYDHPLHPALTHVVVGTVIAAFIFMLTARLTRNAAYIQSTRHCIGLALIFTPLVALAGYLDWQHFFGGAWLWPIRVKIGLAAVLGVVLILAHVMHKGRPLASWRMIAINLLAMGVVIALGYFGGELVHGHGPPSSAHAHRPPMVEEGEIIFEDRCSACHFTDTQATRIGPGLQNLFEWERLPTSGWPISEENVRRQIIDPFASMPAFDTLSERELDALIAYLKTL